MLSSARDNGTSSVQARKLPATKTSLSRAEPCQAITVFTLTTLRLLMVDEPSLTDMTSRGEWRQSPSMTNLYSIGPGGSTMLRAKSPVSRSEVLRRGIGRSQSVNDPAHGALRLRCCCQSVHVPWHQHETFGACTLATLRQIGRPARAHTNHPACCCCGACYHGTTELLGSQTSNNAQIHPPASVTSLPARAAGKVKVVKIALGEVLMVLSVEAVSADSLLHWCLKGRSCILLPSF